MAATSSTAIQGDVPSASELVEPADNRANSESDSASNDSPVVSHVVSLLDRLKAPTQSDLIRKPILTLYFIRNLLIFGE